MTQQIATSSAVDTVPPMSHPTHTATVQTVSSRALLGGGTLVFIEHLGMLYTLRATRSGKLILTK
jgi:hemin uptake protein HemP